MSHLRSAAGLGKLGWLVILIAILIMLNDFFKQVYISSDADGQTLKIADIPEGYNQHFSEPATIAAHWALPKAPPPPKVTKPVVTEPPKNPKVLDAFSIDGYQYQLLGAFAYDESFVTLRLIPPQGAASIHNLKVGEVLQQAELKSITLFDVCFTHPERDFCLHLFKRNNQSVKH